MNGTGEEIHFSNKKHPFVCERTMPKKPKCEFCEKDAIGIQSLGSCVSSVCADHADSSLLALRPGEKQAYDYCYLERFDTADPKEK